MSTNPNHANILRQICQIMEDHMDWSGDTLDAIADVLKWNGYESPHEGGAPDFFTFNRDAFTAASA